jgi:hypothetical protein
MGCLGLSGVCVGLFGVVRGCVGLRVVVLGSCGLYWVVLGRVGLFVVVFGFVLVSTCELVSYTTDGCNFYAKFAQIVRLYCRPVH